MDHLKNKITIIKMFIKFKKTIYEQNEIDNITKTQREILDLRNTIIALKSSLKGFKRTD